MAYFCLANDCLQVRGSLKIIGVRAAHERFDRSLADGSTKEQLDNGVFRHSSNARQYLDQLIIAGIWSSQVDMMHVSSEGFFTFHGQPVQNGLRVFRTTPVFDRFYTQTYKIIITSNNQYAL